MSSAQKSTLTIRELKKAILEVLNSERSQHKFNLIGRDYQGGRLEHHLVATFDNGDRANAVTAFDELKRDGYVQSTFSDVIDPENWVAITVTGRNFLQKNLKDAIDLKLEKIGPQLVVLRQGMLDAAQRTSPDAPRQAAHSARELMDQLLKEGAPAEHATRRERFRYMMKQHGQAGNFSQTDFEIVDATWKVVDAELTKLLSISHSRNNPLRNEVKSSIDAIDRILGVIFGHSS
jgi:hypothetical protein